MSAVYWSRFTPIRMKSTSQVSYVLCIWIPSTGVWKAAGHKVGFPLGDSRGQREIGAWFARQRKPIWLAGDKWWRPNHIHFFFFTRTVWKTGLIIATHFCHAISTTLSSDIDECEHSSEICPSVQSRCINSDGSYRCICNAGFAADGPVCTGRYHAIVSVISHKVM